LYVAGCRILGWALLALAAGCGVDDTSHGTINPLDGYWQGADLSFVLRDSVVESLQMKVHQCANGSCSETCDQQICSAKVGGDVTGTFKTTSKLEIATESVEVSGRFISAKQAQGTLSLVASDGCCKRTGAWSVEWVKPLPGQRRADPDAGPTGPTGPTGGIQGAPGSVDWNGASTGTLHPGPTRSSYSVDQPGGLSDQQKEASTLINDLRATVGCGAVAVDKALAKAAQSHAEFYVKHIDKYQSSETSPHRQDKGFGDGFTGTPKGAVFGWLATVYHRLPLISAQTIDIGFGIAKAGHAKAEVMDVGVRGLDADDPIIVYPWPGQDGVNRRWSGNESPQPQPPSSGYPSGPVITIEVPFTADFGDHQLLGSDGQEVAHVWLTPGNDAILKKFSKRTAAMYANAPLAAQTTYTVRVELRRNNEDHVLKWHFKTGDK
jgi:hypothetical protein